MNRKKVLVVDDDRAMLMGVAFELDSKKRFDVTTSQDKDDAINKIRNNSFDLIISDLLIPDIGDGLKVISQARSMMYNPKILAMTSYGTIHNIILSYRYGVDDFIIKGFGLDELLSHVEILLKDKST